MPAHRMALKGDESNAPWQLEWDDSKFLVNDPEGNLVLEIEPASAHRAIDIFELYHENRVTIVTPEGPLQFKNTNNAAAADLQKFLEARLRSDPEYLKQLRQHSLRLIPRGMLISLVCGAMFALYCWWAFTAPDPPPGHWIRWIGWLIHLILLVLVAGIILGPIVSFTGLRHWLRYRRIDHAAKKSEPEA
ncbi:MAG TPA: hypothetical protein VKS79_12075 [Gemmataceae bacterium]|nr:hypothetical protein [Gemmataceae bacterium]